MSKNNSNDKNSTLKVIETRLIELPTLSSGSALALEISNPLKIAHPGVLIDQLQASGFVAKMNLLKLAFQIVAFNLEWEVDNLKLKIGRKQYSLNPRKTESPQVGSWFPDIEWSGRSRFVINTDLMLVGGFNQGSIMASGGGNESAVARIFRIV